MFDKLRLPALVAVLAVALAVMALVGVGAAHAQWVDDSLPPRADLSIAADRYARSTVWRLDVVNRRVGDHPLAAVKNVKVRVSMEAVSPGVDLSDLEMEGGIGFGYRAVDLRNPQNGYVDGSGLIWTIPDLPPDRTARWRQPVARESAL